MNTFLNEMKNLSNIKETENGGIARKSTNSKILDMFSLGGSYRSRSNDDVITLFEEALLEDETLAMKCLFYLRDIRGGQGERRFFRVAYKWLANTACYFEIAKRNLKNIAEYGRWDDLIYIAEGAPLESEAFDIIKNQFYIDIDSKTPSLLGKWLPSANASSKETKRLARKLIAYMGIDERTYRKSLSALRERIKIVERLMSENRWEEIEFDKIPSKAGLIYKNAFARREIIAEKYEKFAKSKETKVNAKSLYPHDIVKGILRKGILQRGYVQNFSDTEIEMFQKYWDNLPNYYGDRTENAIAVVDVSGSMWGTPLEAAISMGAYVADKSSGPFANHFITFSKSPELVEFSGNNIVEKVINCNNSNWGFNTNIWKVFDLLLTTALSENVKAEDMPQKLYVFSDMEFDYAVSDRTGVAFETETDMEKLAKIWASYGYKLPKLIFWNLDARHNTIPAIGEGFSYISGFSPVMIETILSGKDGYDLMLEKLNSNRYEPVF